MIFHNAHYCKQVDLQNDWKQIFRQKLFKKNSEYLTQNKSKRLRFIGQRKIKMLQRFLYSPSTPQHHKENIKVYPHGYYSSYIPIKNNHLMENQLSEHFFYFKYLQQHDEVVRYSEDSHELVQKIIQNSNDIQKLKEICDGYIPHLTVEQLVDGYFMLKRKGSECLKQILIQYRQQCSLYSLFVHLIQIGTLFQNKAKVNSHLSISMDLKEEITLQNLSKTMKNLFCVICLIYDCQYHNLPNSVRQHDYQYVKPYNIRKRQEIKKDSSLLLLLGICHQKHPLLAKQKKCSSKCFKRFDNEEWGKYCEGRRKKVYSAFFQSLIHMGVELFQFNPCKIRRIVSSEFNYIFSNKLKQGASNIECQDIYYYFMVNYSFMDQLQFKFHNSEIKMLLNDEIERQINKVGEGEKKGRYKKRKIEQNSYNSVCYHYFMNCDPVDQQCRDCECRNRGYCLPECLCSQFCQIPLKGCRCKNNKDCMDNKCFCFKNKRICLPETCEHCFLGDECNNNEKHYNQPVVTHIGQSDIKQAGLGLFVNERVPVGKVIGKYKGQIFENSSLQKLREHFSLDNSFYNFKLTNYQNLDALIYGNKSRFINHGRLNANVCSMYIKIREETIIVFYALRDIEKGEELYFNYNGEESLDSYKCKYPFLM